MRRITLWLFSTVAALVLLFSYRTSTGSPAPAGAAQTTTATGPAATAAGGGKTYTGSVAATRWGDVQVAITVTDGRITDVAVPVYPSGNGKDQEINAYALPVLRQETLAAQNADIDTVSGATVTSDGYRESLQAALDAAHLG
ncbi:FMN-binding protein [Amorphoplanes nipponensis]|uniref:FMN-binding protein n=1 Tax=Actinoplanes nipponensis TaxID=135950 RepID=A0A919JQX6_9ACTN|nr:FMN-binding protein [Actinoplanes nipponensis]GIE53671.1 FMN-binding protein [Actinoplanes nipponensis]